MILFSFKHFKMTDIFNISDIVIYEILELRQINTKLLETRLAECINAV